MKKSRILHNSRILFALASAIAAVSQSSSAAVLAGWDFDPLTGGSGNYGPSPLTATTAAANLTVDGLTRGPGYETTTSAAANAWGGHNTVTTNAADAITAGDFVTFGFTATVGHTVSFTQINAFNVRHPAPGATSGQLQYALGAGAFVDIGSTISYGSVFTAAGNPIAAIVLSGIDELQNVAAGTQVTFRLASFGASATTGPWYLNDPVGAAGDDFVIDGTVAAIPEPSAALLGGLGMLMLLRRRRA